MTARDWGRGDLMDLGSLLAENKIVVGMANFGGLIGLLVAVYAAGRRIRSPIKLVWAPNVRGIMQRYRSYRTRLVAVAARDLHRYQSEIARYLVAIIQALGFAIFTLIQFSNLSLKSTPTRLDLWMAWGDTVLIAYFIVTFATSMSGLKKFIQQVDDARLLYLKAEAFPDGSAAAANDEQIKP
jgi:hypothetical protein